MKDVTIKHCRAWPWWPAWMRTGIGPFRSGYWIKWGKYTRVMAWNYRLNRYRTVDTFPGWITPEEAKGKIEGYEQ